tara:strand:+ start:284 stop:1663 length:1380 start_codon:yes stop_codon:yes gene_type:complete
MPKRRANKKKKLNILWGSEQPIRPTGYGVVSRNLCKRLVARGHTVNVMGWDYNGEPMKHEEGWSMVHAGMANWGGETSGGPNTPTVLESHIMDLKPDVYFSLIDCWYVGHAVVSTNQMGVPYVGYFPMDGYPISYAWKDILKMIHTPLWMAHFGKNIFTDFVKQYHSGGSADKELRDPVLDRYLENTGEVLWHGVDSDVFAPMGDLEKIEIKKRMGIGHFDFTFLHVGRNANRKQIPRLLEAFKIFLDQIDDPDRVGLLIHCGDPHDTKGMGGWNLPLMVKQMGLHKNIKFTDRGSNPLYGLSREELAMVYGVSDVHVLSTSGEGFGVPSAEAMSCGLPIILPDNSTGPELTGAHPDQKQEVEEKGLARTERGWIVRNLTTVTGPKWGVNMGLVDILALSRAMKDAYDNPDLVKDVGANARVWAIENLDWDMLTDQLESILYKAAETEHPLAGNSTMGV